MERNNKVLKTLGGALFDNEFCVSHSGTLKLCTNSVDCSSRSLWQMIQFIVDQFLDKITLQDLVKSEKDSVKVFEEMLSHHLVTKRDYETAHADNKA